MVFGEGGVRYEFRWLEENELKDKALGGMTVGLEASTLFLQSTYGKWATVGQN
jgi:hypothetical protein